MVADMAVRRTRGDGGLHFKASRGLWVARVDLGIGGDGKRRSKEVASKDYATAVKKLRELRRQVEDHGAAPTPTMTLTQWIDHWLAQTVALERDPKTLDGYRSACETWIKPTLGAHRLERLEAQHVRDLHRKMRDAGRAESSVLKVHNVLAKALKDAMGETSLRRNVTANVQRPKAARRTQHLSTEQAKRLLATVQRDPNGARRAVSLYHGVRQGEVLGLQWDRIDLTDGTIDYAWQLQRLIYAHGCDGDCGRKRPGSCPQRKIAVQPGFEFTQLEGGLCLTRPKSARSQRLLPIPAPLLGWLVGRKAQQDGQPNPHGLVFTRDDGRPIDPRDDLRAWHDALTAASLPEVMLHAARHTTATLLREAGVPTDVIASVLGHASAVTTRGYLHEDLTLARDAFARLQIEG